MYLFNNILIIMNGQILDICIQNEESKFILIKHDNIVYNDYEFYDNCIFHV